MNEKLLLVTFPVDLGNQTFEKRFVKLFEDCLDLKVYRFIPDQNKVDSNRKYIATLGRRAASSLELQQKVREAIKEGRRILFHGISPALFAYPAIQRNNACIVTDWTRKLYEPITGERMSPQWVTQIHRHILNFQKSVICLTDSVLEEIKTDYHIPPQKLKKGKLPFSIDLDLFKPSPNRNDGKTRILFVGGDFDRKGGDKLLRWFEEHRTPDLELTMVTGHSLGNMDGVTVKNNIHYGQPEHVELYRSHDIFVLPTKCDSYPSVLGEAACAGLAVVTSRFALGAPDVVKNSINGFIGSSQEETLKQLGDLIFNRSLIQSMKLKSRKLMETEFSTERVLGEYLDVIFGESPYGKN